MAERIAPGGMATIVDEDTGRPLGFRDTAGRNWPIAGWAADANGNVVGLVGPNGEQVQAVGLPMPLVSGQWIACPPLCRLRLVGSGTVSFDARDALGAVSSAVFSATAASATNQIEFPYFGDTAFAVRPTFPQTLQVQVV